MSGHGGAYESLRRWLRARVVAPWHRRRSPLLSVVVPVYNVEKYLAECLDSVLAQPYRDVEVVLVDDGSTDSSGEIARRYADAHRSIRLVSQANGGLGAARNAGVAHARGEYLTFLDSDDRLPPDAWSAAMATLERSGSDFAIGKLLKDGGDRQYAMPRMRENHRVRRVGITVEQMPLILADVFAVNKIFRRTFWDRAGLDFPTKIHYEDQPTMTRAFFAAERFDVLTQTVYLWRTRTDGSSITQRRNDVADLHDRILTKRISTETVAEMAPHMLDLWRREILPVDMWEYFLAVPGCSEAYWALLRQGVAEFWADEHVPFHESRVPVQHRLMGWYVSEDRRGDLERLIVFLDPPAGELPLEQRGDRVVALMPGIDEPGLPESTYTLADHETTLEARIVEATWDGSRLDLRAFALIRNVPTGGRETTLTARLVADDGRSVELAVRPEREALATQLVNRAGQDFDDCGFTASVDVASLTVWGATTWRFELERTVDGLRRSGGLTGFGRRHVCRSWTDLPGEVPSAVVRRARLCQEGVGLVLVVESA